MKRNLLPRSLKRGLLAVPAAALMLGAAQAGTTVGLNFQAWYYSDGGAGYQTTGFPVTAKAFGVELAEWTSTDPIDCQSPASTNVPFGGTLTANLTAPNAWQSGIGEQVAGFVPQTVAPGNDEVTWGYLDDGNADGLSPQVTVSGLATKFANGYVVTTIAASSGVKIFDDVDVTDGVATSTITYFTYYVTNPQSDGYVVGGTVGVSAPSGVFTNDTININCQPKTTGKRSILAGFIITDKPFIGRNPVGGVFVEGSPFVLSAGVSGVPALAYQWRTNGVALPGATSESYTNTSSLAASAGNYDLVVTNPYGAATSAVATVSIVVAHPAQTVTWDADTGTSGAQDGDGTWNYTPAHWWNGVIDDTWWINDTAVFGAGGAGPYTVTLGASMTANAVTFNGGNYTITNVSGASLSLDGAAAITANAAATIAAPVTTGTNTFLKTGTGTLTLSGALGSGRTFVRAGTLEVQSKSGDSPYVVTNGATLKIGHNTGGGYANTALQLYGDGTAATTGLYLKGGITYNVSGTFSFLGAPTTVRQYGTGRAGLGIFDINSTGLLCTAPASGSIIDANVQMVNNGYGMSGQVDAGVNTATGDLILNGPLSIDARNGVYGFVKRGNGSLRLNAVATTTNSGLDIRAGSAICGINNCIGANATLKVVGGAKLNFNGTSQTVSNAVLAGNLTMTINKGGTPSSSVLTVTDGSGLVFDGTLTAINVGGALVLGDTFTLFSSSGGYSGAFTNLNLPTLANGLGWQNNLAVDGTIKVVVGSVPPSIVTDLSGTTNNVYVGGSATFVITAAGDPTLRYQWKKNGNTPVGSDNPSLTLNAVTLADGGSYSVTVTNNYGSVSSLTNRLTVLTPSGYSALVNVDGPLAYWPLNDTAGTTADDVWGINDATYFNAYYLNQAGPLPGTLGVGFDGSAGTYALAPYSAALNPVVFSVEAWVNPAVESANCPISCGDFGNPRAGWLFYQAAAGWNFRTYRGTDQATAANITGTTVPAIGAWTYLAATWDGNTARLYVNGVLEGSQVPTTTPKYLPGSSGGFCIGARADNAFRWNGTASEVALYNHVLTPAEIQSHAANVPIITVTRSGADLILAWPAGTGNLQAAPEATGTYTNVPAATSPFSVTPSAARSFFRIVN